MAKTRKFLIVEDDPWVARLLEFSARDRGYEPLVVRDGLQASETFFDELPDAVITDAVLPHLDGLELSRRIKSCRAGIFTPVVIFSGILQEDRESLTRSRADAFFAKPVSPDAVTACLDSFAPRPLQLAEATELGPTTHGEISLAAQPLPLALARLHHQKQTGVLRIRVPAGAVELLLRNGHLVQVRSSGWTETLPDALVRLGKISNDERERLMDAGSPEEPWFEHGSRAVRDGVLAAGEAEKVWAAVQSGRVIEAYGWSDGYHRFESAAVQASSADLPLDTPALIHWGLRRAELPERALEQEVPSLTGRVHRTEQADHRLQLLPLSRSEKWLLERANGQASLETLGRQVAGDARATDGLARSAIVLHALGALTIDIPRLLIPDVSDVAEDQVIEAEELPAPELRGGPAEMLLTLWQARVTGIFAADVGPARHLFYLRNGQLVASRSSEIERLDSLLAQRGRIRPEVLPRIRQLVESGRNVGEALVEEKAIGAPQLHAFVRGELRASLGELLRATESTVSFTELPLPMNELAPHGWDTAQAVVEVARAQDLAQVQRLLPGPDAYIHRSDDQDRASDLALSPAERLLFNLLMGPQRARRLAGSGLSQADTDRALAVLLTLGLVHVAPGEALPPLEVPAPAPTPVVLPTRRRNRDPLFALPEPVEEKPATEDTVPRALYLALLEEKQALEARLANGVDHDGCVERDRYEQLLREKAELKAKVGSLLSELRRMREPDSGTFPSEREISGRALLHTASEPVRQLALVSAIDD